MDTARIIIKLNLLAIGIDDLFWRFVFPTNWEPEREYAIT
jgi:hypothetical protein